MINKELLSEVLLGTENEECVRIEVSKFGNNLIYYSFKFKEKNSDGTHSFQDEQINIHELAHKCKEWARVKGYILTSCPYEIYCQYRGNEDNKLYCTCYINISEHENGIDYDKYFEADTESEAIFKACQWILDNKE